MNHFGLQTGRWVRISSSETNNRRAQSGDSYEFRTAAFVGSESGHSGVSQGIAWTVSLDDGNCERRRRIASKTRREQFAHSNSVLLAEKHTNRTQIQSIERSSRSFCNIRHQFLILIVFVSKHVFRKNLQIWRLALSTKQKSVWIFSAAKTNNKNEPSVYR